MPEMFDYFAAIMIASPFYGLSVLAVIIPLFFVKRGNARIGLIPVVIPAAFSISVLSLAGALGNVIQLFQRMANEQLADFETIVGETEEALLLSIFGSFITLVILVVVVVLFMFFRSKQVDVQSERTTPTGKTRLLAVITIVSAVLSLILLIYGNWVCITPMNVLVSDPSPGLVTSYVFSAGYHHMDDAGAVSEIMAERFASTFFWSSVAFIILLGIACVSGMIGRGLTFSGRHVKKSMYFVLVLCLLLVLFLFGLGAQISWLQELVAGS